MESMALESAAKELGGDYFLNVRVRVRSVYLCYLPFEGRANSKSIV